MSDSSNDNDNDKEIKTSEKKVMPEKERKEKLRKLELINSIIEDIEKEKAEKEKAKKDTQSDKKEDKKPDNKANKSDNKASDNKGDKKADKSDKSDNITDDKKDDNKPDNKDKTTNDKKTDKKDTATGDKQVYKSDKSNNITDDKKDDNKPDNKDSITSSNESDKKTNKADKSDNKNDNDTNTNDKKDINSSISSANQKSNADKIQASTDNLKDEDSSNKNKKQNDVVYKSLSAVVNNKSSDKKIKSKSATRKIFSGNNTTNLKVYLICALTVILVLLIIVFINFDKFKTNKVESLKEDATTNSEDSKDSDGSDNGENDEKETSTSLYAVGDNICYEDIYASGKQGNSLSYDHLFKNIQDDIQKADTAVINQETVFYPTMSGYPTFGSPKEIASSLVNVGFDVVLHATNHSADKGLEGLNYTFTAWKDYPQINILGINETQSDADKTTVIEKNGIKIAMLNYTYGLNGLSLPEPYKVNVFTGNEEKVKQDVTKAKDQADCVVVFMHWGAENVLHQNDEQKRWASILSNSGADLIIGSHPHVIQPVEWITSDTGHKTLVYYSLGNLISSQNSINNFVGASCNVTFTKKGDKTSISKADVTPTFMHIQRPYNDNTSVYRLSDYDENLASKHSYSFIRNKSSVTKARNLANEILGSDSTVNIPIENESSQIDNNN